MTEQKNENMNVEDRAESILEDLVRHRGGQRRDPQVRLSRGIARHQESGKTLIVQAPTGVGKSYSAIAAALSSGKPTIIAPTTHALQQQLQDDAIMLSEATGGFSVAVLKGRSSYFCKLRGSQMTDDYKAASENGTAFDPEDETLKVLDWAEETETGDKAELDFPVSNEVWRQVSVSSDQCAGKGCPFYRSCFAEKARTRIKDAQLGIMNHALVAQGMRQENFLDGAFKNIILDECQEFAHVVGEAFGATVTSNKLKWALNQGRRIGNEGQRQQFEEAIERIGRLGRGVHEPLRHLNGHHVMTYINKMSSILASWVITLDGNKGEKNYILKQSLYTLMQHLDLVAKGDTKVQTAWIEWGSDDAFTLRSVMFNVAGVVKNDLIDQYDSTVFMSATVKTGDSFAPAAGRLGVNRCEEWTGAEIPHLFDYQNNGLIWLPSRMKEPSHPEYLNQVAMVSKAAINAAQGRTLILCTSWKGVETIGLTLRKHLPKADFPVLMQQSGVNLRHMSAEFRDNPHSVLIGTRSLWTGVSFEGATCACVIQDKVPFPSPADPIIAARCEAVEDAGGSAFGSVLIPEAGNTMAQGAGRLHRTPTDQGVLVLPDPRLNSMSQHYKQYGSRLLKTLPPMPITHDTNVALERLRQIHAEAA